jgi:hypothetical protein
MRLPAIIAAANEMMGQPAPVNDGYRASLRFRFKQPYREKDQQVDDAKPDNGYRGQRQFYRGRGRGGAVEHIVRNRETFRQVRNGVIYVSIPAGEDPEEYINDYEATNMQSNAGGSEVSYNSNTRNNYRDRPQRGFNKRGRGVSYHQRNFKS